MNSNLKHTIFNDLVKIVTVYSILIISRLLYAVC